MQIVHGQIQGAQVSEGLIQDQIRLALGRVPGLVLWRNNCGSYQQGKAWIKYGVGNPGGADLIGLWSGRFVAIEVKSSTGKQTEHQRNWQGIVEENGGLYVIARSASEAYEYFTR